MLEVLNGKLTLIFVFSTSALNLSNILIRGKLASFNILLNLILAFEFLEIPSQVSNFLLLNGHADFMSAAKFTELHVLIFVVFGQFSVKLNLLFRHLCVFLRTNRFDLTADFHAVDFSDTFKLLTVLGLHVLEDRLALNQDVSDFDGLKPDTPTLNDFCHFITDLSAKFLALLQHLLSG